MWKHHNLTAITPCRHSLTVHVQCMAVIHIKCNMVKRQPGKWQCLLPINWYKFVYRLFEKYAYNVSIYHVLHTLYFMCLSKSQHTEEWSIYDVHLFVSSTLSCSNVICSAAVVSRFEMWTHAHTNSIVSSVHRAGEVFCIVSPKYSTVWKCD